MSLTVRVISPDQTVLDASAEEVILPSSTGQLGILTDHAPLTTVLDIGVLRYRQDKAWNAIAVLGGVAEIEDNEITVLVNSAEAGSSINAETARQEVQAAETRVNTLKEGDKQGKIQAEQALKRARARLQATTAS